MTTTRKTIAVAALLLLVGGFFYAGLHQGIDSPASGSSDGQRTITTADFASPLHRNTAATKSEQRIDVTQNTKASPHGALLDGTVRLASYDEATLDGFRRVSIHRTSFKYPLIRVVEEFQNGSDVPIRSLAMVADHLLVRANAEERPELDDFLANHSGLSVRHTLHTGEHLLLRVPDAMTPDAIETWQKELLQAGFSTAGPDYIYTHSAVTPDDSDFAQLWGLHNTGQNGGTNDADIDAPEAWDITTGSDNVIVAVIDCGVDYNHPDLSANIWTNANGKHGYDYYDNDSDPNDTSLAGSAGHGHGTHCAGTIAARGNNATGVTGVAWKAKIMALRFINNNSGSTSDAIDCIRYATDNGAKIASNSWGGGDGFAGDALQQEIERAKNHGMLFVVAAGNGGADQIGDNLDNQPDYPACYNVDNILTVAATDRNDALTSFSNFGATTVDIAAPGQEIRSTMPGNSYGLMSGTSMACPHVSGVAALILAAKPTLTYSQIRTRIINNDDNLAGLNGKCVSGGRMNAYKCVQDLAGPLLALSRKNTAITGGNNDSYPNPGESVRIDLTLANNGSQSAAGSTITASLSAGAPATLNRTTLNVGTLAAGASSLQDNAFTLTLNSSAPLPSTFTVNFTLQTSSTTMTWSDSIQITAYESAVVRGLVTRAATGEPIVGANITIRGPVNLDLATGSDGRYSASAVAGNYQLSASTSGLVGSGVRDVTLNSTPSDQNFSLGAASLSLAPTDIHFTMPPGQIRAFDVTAIQTGDTPRSIPIQTEITGTGLSVDQLYGFDINYSTNTIEVHEINPNTGARIASHTIVGLSQQESILGTACLQNKIWIYTSQWNGNGTSTGRIYPLDPATWTLATATVLAPPSGSSFNGGLTATADKLLLPIRVNNTARLYSCQPDTGLLNLVGTLPQNYRDSIAYSPSRSSIFVTIFAFPNDIVRELSYPGLTPIREWSPPSTSVMSMAYDEKQAALFTSAYATSGNSSTSLTKRNPDNGTPIAGFSPYAGIEYVAVNSSAGAGWLTTTLSTSEVPTAGSRTIPLRVNTTGMTLGQSFTAQLHTHSSLAADPDPVTVHLTVGVPDPSVWEGWFENRYGRGPVTADRNADPDGDGIPTYLEFATGGDPDNSASYVGRPSAKPSNDGTFMEFTFDRRRNLSEGAIIPHSSADLIHWQTAPAGTVATVDQNFERVTIQVPFSTEPHRFFRLSAP